MLDEKRKDWRIARICAVLCNIHRDRKKRVRAFSEVDFMPRAEKARTAGRTTAETFMMLHKLSGGKVIKKNGAR